MGNILLLCVVFAAGAGLTVLLVKPALPKQGEVRKHIEDKAAQMAAGVETLKKLNAEGGLCVAFTGDGRPNFADAPVREEL